MVSQPKQVEATTTINVENISKMPLKKEDYEKITALFLSDAVFLDTVAYFNEQVSAFTKQRFYNSISLSKSDYGIVLSFFDFQKDKAENGLTAWLKAIDKQVQNFNIIQHQSDSSEELSILYKAIKDLINEFKKDMDNAVGTHPNSSEINRQYALYFEVLSKKIFYDAAVKTLENGLSENRSPLFLELISDDKIVSQLTVKLNQLNQQLSHMQTQLADDNPQIQAMKAEKQTLEKEQRKAITLAVERLYSKRQIASDIEIDFRKEFIEIRGDRRKIECIFENIEKKLDTLFSNFKKTYKLDAAIAMNKFRIVQKNPINFKYQSVFLTYKYLLFGSSLALFVGLWFGSLFIEKWYVKRRYQRAHRQLSDQKSDHQNDPGFSIKVVSVDETLALLAKLKAHKVLFVGEGAAQGAAQIAFRLKNEQNSILIVDICSKEIEKLIGLHRGFVDVLTKEAQLSEVIYHDYDTDVDILPQGLAQSELVSSFINDIPNLIQKINETYDQILFVIETPPPYAMEAFFNLSDCIIIAQKAKKETDQWMYEFDQKNEKPVVKLLF
ncbi:hypothetical protein [Bartonella tamiae]|uniref:Uncharacterized protein n=1 Tax=Bartonella tamiae Th239 TaxID=1094558 RepID=J0ZKH5_9HYPH|nr:hypothetical protein [Bartonella tamiae]EJF88858.1 hypothetical protein ME5_01409 [Bartonella tamiae Th239]EJF94892.1 hypothetical protein MEG_00473 [Bartonella tamiae Th307]